MNETDITSILERVHPDNPEASAQLLELVYEELRRLAASKMARESPGQTLAPTALVHEAWLRLGGDQQPRWRNRAHYFAAAAESMRRILVDNARRKRAIRHGGYSNPSAFPIAVPGANHWLVTDSETDIHDGSIVQRSVHLSCLATPREVRYWAKAWRAAGVVFNREDSK